MHPTAKQQVFQTSIGLGTMVMMDSSSSSASAPDASSTTSTPTSPTKSHTDDRPQQEHQHPNFHRRNTIVRANGRSKQCPEPPLTATLRRGEVDDDEDDQNNIIPLTPPTRTKSVVARPRGRRLVEL